MELKETVISDPVDASQIRALRESVAESLRQIPEQSELSITPVRAGRYIVKNTDRRLMVDPRGGPVQIVLPLPKVRQELMIKNLYTSRNAITVVRTDGKPLGNGNVSAVVSDDANGPAMNMLDDGSQWWVL